MKALKSQQQPAPPYDYEAAKRQMIQAKAGIPADSRIYGWNVMSIGDRIEEIMTAKGISRTELAKRTGKSKAEVTRWMSGTHNFTLRTLAIVEAALGEPVIEVAAKTPEEKEAASRTRIQYLEDLIEEMRAEILWLVEKQQPPQPEAHVAQQVQQTLHADHKPAPIPVR